MVKNISNLEIDAKEFQLVAAEISSLKALDSPGIIKYFDAEPFIFPSKVKKIKRFGIVTELMNGSLRDYMKMKSKGEEKEKEEKMKEEESDEEVVVKGLPYEEAI